MVDVGYIARMRKPMTRQDGAALEEPSQDEYETWLADEIAALLADPERRATMAAAMRAAARPDAARDIVDRLASLTARA